QARQVPREARLREEARRQGRQEARPDGRQAQLRQGLTSDHGKPPPGGFPGWPPMSFRPGPGLRGQAKGDSIKPKVIPGIATSVDGYITRKIATRAGN